MNLKKFGLNSSRYENSTDVAPLKPLSKLDWCDDDIHSTNYYKFVICILNRFREDVFKEGEVGGHCHFKKNLHKNQGKNKSPLQSWWVNESTVKKLCEK